MFGPLLVVERLLGLSVVAIHFRIRGERRGLKHLIMCSGSSAGNQSICSPYDALAPIQLPGESYTATSFIATLCSEKEGSTKR